MPESPASGQAMKPDNKSIADSAMKNTMTYKGYTASMEFDADDRILVGRVLHIDDIISFHGDSVAEFEAAFKESVDDKYAISIKSFILVPFPIIALSFIAAISGREAIRILSTNKSF